MDTTKYLLKILDVKSEPGGVPLIKRETLDVIEHAVLINQPEMVLHVASSYNEPEIVKYILQRYNLNPNQISIADSEYNSYMCAIMFNCQQVIDVFFEQRLYPENWYLFLLFLRIFDQFDRIEQVISEYSKEIKTVLDKLERAKLIEFFGSGDLYEKQVIHDFIDSLKD